MPVSEMNAFQTSRRDKIMGVVVFGALLVLVYLSFYGADLQGVGFGGNNYYTRMSKSYGITSGGVVSLSGVRVGTIRAVDLEENGRVLITLYLDPGYGRFFREGSQLHVDSQLALGNVISGNGLIFVPGEPGAPLLPPEAVIPSLEPQSLDEMMEEWNVRELALQVQKIVTDIGELVSSVNDNQGQLIETLSHSAQVSANLAESTAQIPQLIVDINHLLVNVNARIEQLGGDATAISGEMSQVMQNTGKLTESLNSLAESLAPTAARSPILLDNLIQVSRETEVLLHKLNQHWLLGGAEAARTPVQRLDLPADDRLYAQ